MSVSRTARDGRRTGRMMATAVMGWLVVAALAGVAAAQDQAAAPVPVLTLDECIRQALAGSPTLQISAQQREIAAQNVRGAKGAFLPNLSLSYNWQKSERTDFDVAQSQAGTYSIPTTDPGISVLFPTQVPSGEIADETVSATYKSLGGRATLNVFDGFAKYGNLRSAKNSLGAADATVGYTRERVVEDVVAAYYNLVRYEKLAEVAREAQEQAARELERTETYFRLGSAAKSDVLQQRVQLGNTKLDVVVAENSIKKGQADLAYAMNLPLQGSFAVDPTVLETDFAVADVTELYAEALRNRLDLQSSELALEARRQDVKAARGSLFPQVDVYGNYGRDNNESPFKFGAQISSSTSYGYAVSWNIFDRLQTYSGISRAKASARIAEYQLEQARLNAQVEIRQLHNALVEARERADVSRETIVQAEEGLRLAQERFRVGAGTALDVIVAQVNLTTARAQEVQAKVDFLIARSSLDRALGRRNAETGN
ncbi:MAG: TolC family protein [bacterium]|nr:TolC family protein [bacterium]